MKANDLCPALGFGKIWLPKERTCLGRLAGRRVRLTILKEAQRSPVLRRGLDRSPLYEVSAFLAHKCGGPKKARQLLGKEPSDFKAALQKKRRTSIRTMSGFIKAPLF